MIEVRNLTYSVGRKSILDAITFTASPGEFMTIIGPNGAGKSTLMKLLCGELPLQRGDITLNGREIRQYSTLEMARFRAVLAQSNQVSINFTVFEIVLMGRYPHFKGRPTAEDFRIVNEVLEEMGMQDFVSRPYYSLSGGEQQRVHLARILIQIHGNPKGILLLDEPINGLDLQYQQIILNKARQLADAGRTVVCVLHDINFASKYADNILILKNGMCMGLGHPQDIISEDNIFNTYQTKVRLIHDHSIGYPFIVPIS